MYSVIKANRFVLFFIVHFILGSFVVFTISENVPLFSGTLASIALSQILLVFLPAIYYFLLTRQPIFSTLRFQKTKAVNVLLSLFLAILIIPMMMFINLLSQFFVKSAVADTLSEISSAPFILSLIIVSLFPAVFEEIIARGILLHNYKNKSFLIAALMSGLFFGMMHLNINQFLYAFFLGFIFAVVVQITESLICSMVMHFVINGLNLGLAYLASSDFFTSLAESQDIASIDQNQALLTAIPAVLLLIVMSLPFIGIILFALISINDKWGLIKKNAPSKEFFEADLDSRRIELFMETVAEETQGGESVSRFDEQDNKKENVFTFSLIFSVILFLAISIFTEMM